MRREQLDYGRMMQRALRGVMHEALSTVAAEGLPGAHHFYITLDCRHPALHMPDWLRAEYPDQITIVLQYEYDGLEVDADGFSVSMSFADRPARLYAPFDAVLTFVDPSVEFGLKFDGAIPDSEEDEADDESGDDEDGERESAEVLSLDKFRKT